MSDTNTQNTLQIKFINQINCEQIYVKKFHSTSLATWRQTYEYGQINHFLLQIKISNQETENSQNDLNNFQVHDHLIESNIYQFTISPSQFKLFSNQL